MKVTLTTTKDFAEAVAGINRDAYANELECFDRALAKSYAKVANIDVSSAHPHIEIAIPDNDYSSARAFQMQMRLHPLMHDKVLLAKVNF